MLTNVAVLTWAATYGLTEAQVRAFLDTLPADTRRVEVSPLCVLLQQIRDILRVSLLIWHREAPLHTSDEHVTGSACPALSRHHPILDKAGHGLRLRDDSGSILLSRDRFALLRCLATSPPGAVVPYTAMALAVYPDELLPPPVADDRMRQHIGWLRVIAVKAGWPVRIIDTAWGVGARLDWRYGLEPRRAKSHKVLAKFSHS